MVSGIHDLASKYREILGKTELYVLSFPGTWEHLNLNPWGLEVRHRISCVDQTQARFFDLLHSLDGLAFGPVGMPMEKWVFFDCGEMPGAVVGLAVRANQLTAEARAEYKVDDRFEGIIPISMYIAIPMAGGKHWFGHNLSSANRVLNGSFSGLGILTKALGLKVMQVESLYGVTQWNSVSLELHLQLAQMDIVSAYTPAHSFKNSVTYRSLYPDKTLREALSGVRRDAVAYDFLYPSDDEAFSIEMQKRVAAGEKFRIVGRPVQQGAKPFYPIARIG